MARYLLVKDDIAEAVKFAKENLWCVAAMNISNGILTIKDGLRGTKREDSTARRMMTRTLHKLADMLHSYADNWQEGEGGSIGN